jgi:transcriptional regulator with XRE-family HTH domain
VAVQAALHHSNLATPSIYVPSWRGRWIPGGPGWPPSSDSRVGERSPRQRRTALGWTLEHVAAQAQVSVDMVSLIETGERRPSLRSWERIRQTLGHQRAAARGGLRPQPREISDELVAACGACLAPALQASLAEPASATRCSRYRRPAGPAAAGRAGWSRPACWFLSAHTRLLQLLKVLTLEEARGGWVYRLATPPPLSRSENLSPSC